jgi:parvulin-like peptidyl-prolyl isomerase
MFDPSKGPDDMERARGKAEEILRKARSGEDFATLARKYSEDAYKEKGGDLGYITRGSMDPEIEKAVFGLQPGEMTGPLETQYGFYLIRVEDRKPERTFPFDEVKTVVWKKIEAKKKDERMIEWLGSLRKKAKIEYKEQGAQH